MFEGQGLPGWGKHHIAGEELEVVDQFFGVALPGQYYQQSVAEAFKDAGDGESSAAGCDRPNGVEIGQRRGAPTR